MRIRWLGRERGGERERGESARCFFVFLQKPRGENIFHPFSVCGISLLSRANSPRRSSLLPSTLPLRDSIGERPDVSTMTSPTSIKKTAELATTMMRTNLHSTETTTSTTTSTTTTTTTGVDLDRDVLSEIFSRLLDPQDLATVPCVCRHWRRAAEEEGDEDRNWRSAAESLGLGLEVAEEEEKEQEKGNAAAVAVTLDRRALRSGAPALPTPPSSTWKARVRAAWPELCFECRLPDSGRRRSKQQQRGNGGGGGGAGGEVATSTSSASSSSLSPPRTLSIRHCHSCSSASAEADRQRKTNTRLVDAPTALRILRSGGSGESEEDGGGGSDGNESEEDGDGQRSDEEPNLLLLLSKLPRSLDVRPQDPRFRTVELFRRRDVRALARGFERDIYY